MLTQVNKSLLVGLWLLPLLVSSFVRTLPTTRTLPSSLSTRTISSEPATGTPATRLQYKEYPWEEGSEVNKDESLTKYQEEETLLQINCKAMHETPMEEVVIPRVQEYIASFMFKRVLPVQHLQTIPTDDGGLEILFWRPAFDQSHVDGGMRFFVVLPTDDNQTKTKKKKKNGDTGEKDEIFFKDESKNKGGNNNKSKKSNKNSNYFQIIVKRQSEGQTCRKATTEKLVIQAFLKAFVGKDREKEFSTQDPPTHDVCTMESVFHKWMFSA